MIDLFDDVGILQGKLDIDVEGKSFCWHSTYSPCAESVFWESTWIMFGQVGRNAISDKDDEILSGADMNRTAPKYFLQCPRARSAVKNEVLGLVNIARGKAALELTSGRDERWKGCKRSHILIIKKRKSARDYRSTLVLRGDAVREQDVAFTSAPTASRGSIQCVLTMAALYGLTLGVLDAPQAFFAKRQFVRA